MSLSMFWPDSRSPLQETDEAIANASKTPEHIRNGAIKDNWKNPEGRKAFAEAMERGS